MPRLPLAAAAVLLLGLGAGCPANTNGARRADAPRGPRMRFVDAEERAPARLVLEIDPRRRPVGPATLHTFTMSVEEKIRAEGDSAHVEARLIEVVGASGEPQLSDQLALAMDELKISFRRNARGEVSDVKLEALRPPLDEPTAHAIISAVFYAHRGPRLPDKPVGLQDDWTVESDLEVVGLTAHQRHFYTLTGEGETTLDLREKGHVEGIATINGSRRKIVADTFSQETIDLHRGVVVSGEYEWTSQVDEEPPPAQDLPGIGRTKIRVERGRVAQHRKRR
jgi:hypothetical protein